MGLHKVDPQSVSLQKVDPKRWASRRRTFKRWASRWWASQRWNFISPNSIEGWSSGYADIWPISFPPWGVHTSKVRNFGLDNSWRHRLTTSIDYGWLISWIGVSPWRLDKGRWNPRGLSHTRMGDNNIDIHGRYTDYQFPYNNILSHAGNISRG